MRIEIKPEPTTSTRQSTFVEARLGIPEVFIEFDGQRRCFSVIQTKHVYATIMKHDVLELDGQRHSLLAFEKRVTAFSLLKAIGVAENSSTTIPDNEDVASSIEEDKE